MPRDRGSRDQIPTAAYNINPAIQLNFILANAFFVDLDHC